MTFRIGLVQYNIGTLFDKEYYYLGDPVPVLIGMENDVFITRWFSNTVPGLKEGDVVLYDVITDEIKKIRINELKNVEIGKDR